MSLYSKISTDDLWIIGAEDPSPEVFVELLQRLTPENAAASGDSLDFFLDNLGGDDDSRIHPAQAEFLIAASGRGIPDSAPLRKALADAIRMSLPPYLAKTPVVRATGIRSNEVPLATVSRRIEVLRGLTTGCAAFLRDSGKWVTVVSVNALTATAVLSPLSSGGEISMPLESLLEQAVLFHPGPEVLKISDSKRKPLFPSEDYRTMVHKKLKSRISDAEIREIACRTLVPTAMSESEFAAWYDRCAPAAAPKTRRSCDGRSLLEILVLLKNEEEAGIEDKFDGDGVKALNAFFARLRPQSAVAEVKQLAEAVARIASRSKPEDHEFIFAPLVDKAPFWPSDTESTPLEDFGVWGEISAKLLPHFTLATRSLFDDNYLAGYAVRLPLKALNAYCDGVDNGTLVSTFASLRDSSSDLILWIWKNRKKLPAGLLSLVNIDNVVSALNQQQLPKAWQSAQRDLRKHLMDKADFQQQLIDAAGGQASLLISCLQSGTFFLAGERQSLLVKLSRLSGAVKQFIEKGAGERMLADEQVGKPKAAVVEPLFTFPASHRRLLQELDDIINIHQPENREALKAARAHGDFRENSEFDAAKERRNYLTRRRNELENDIARVEAVPCENIEVGDVAVLGCTVDLRFSDGTLETYHLLGAWDGNPEKNYLSYKTRLGEVIYGQRLGSEITTPDHRKCRIEALRPLTAEIIADLK